MTVEETRLAAAADPLVEEEKRVAGEAAAALVHSGMKVGLGTGSTICYTIEALGRMCQSGALTDLVVVATSERTATLARGLGLPVRNLSDLIELDMTIDGADEVDPQMQLIKGLGGALLREKIVASSSSRLVVVVDRHKLVKKLGTTAPVPVEVDAFAAKATQMKLGELPRCTPVPRLTADGSPYRTDGGHAIIECYFQDGIDDAPELERAIRSIPGALECGLFLGMAKKVIVGAPDTALQMELGGELRPLA